MSDAAHPISEHGDPAKVVAGVEAAWSCGNKEQASELLSRELLQFNQTHDNPYEQRRFLTALKNGLKQYGIDSQELGVLPDTSITFGSRKSDAAPAPPAAPPVARQPELPMPGTAQAGGVFGDVEAQGAAYNSRIIENALATPVREMSKGFFDAVYKDSPSLAATIAATAVITAKAPGVITAGLVFGAGELITNPSAAKEWLGKRLSAMATLSNATPEQLKNDPELQRKYNEASQLMQGVGNEGAHALAGGIGMTGAAKSAVVPAFDTAAAAAQKLMFKTWSSLLDDGALVPAAAGRAPYMVSNLQDRPDVPAMKMTNQDEGRGGGGEKPTTPTALSGLPEYVQKAALGEGLDTPEKIAALSAEQFALVGKRVLGFNIGKSGLANTAQWLESHGTFFGDHLAGLPPQVKEVARQAGLTEPGQLANMTADQFRALGTQTSSGRPFSDDIVRDTNHWLENHGLAFQKPTPSERALGRPAPPETTTPPAIPPERMPGTMLNRAQQLIGAAVKDPRIGLDRVFGREGLTTISEYANNPTQRQIVSLGQIAYEVGAKSSNLTKEVFDRLQHNADEVYRTSSQTARDARSRYEGLTGEAKKNAKADYDKAENERRAAELVKRATQLLTNRWTNLGATGGVVPSEVAVAQAATPGQQVREAPTAPEGQPPWSTAKDDKVQMVFTNRTAEDYFRSQYQQLGREDPSGRDQIRINQRLDKLKQGDLGDQEDVPGVSGLRRMLVPSLGGTKELMIYYRRQALQPTADGSYVGTVILEGISDTSRESQGRVINQIATRVNPGRRGS